MNHHGLLIVICGPSGAGKGTVFSNILQRLPDMKSSVSVTTREPRPGEVEGKDYYFRTIEQYQQMIAEGGFLETASVFNNYYGTPKGPVMEMLGSGNDVMFEIDVEGAKQIKAKYPLSILIFLMTPGFEELERRLRSRGTESEESIRTRLGGAKGELKQYALFDYLVINDKVEKAADDIVAIIKAEKNRMKFNEKYVKEMLNAN